MYPIVISCVFWRQSKFIPMNCCKVIVKVIAVVVAMLIKRTATGIMYLGV